VPVPHRRTGRFALAAALVGVAVFVGSWFTPDPWHRAMTWTIGDAMRAASIVLWFAAFALGAIGWRGNTPAKVAVGLAVCFPALIIFVIATANFQ
jgi:hypothetical protein